MFTGIIESQGRIEELRKEGTNVHIRVSSPISAELKIDQSLAHNGVCLTITSAGPDSHEVTAVEETLKRSNLGQLMVGDLVNLERCMAAGGRFDGHIVQGHVDQVAVVDQIEDRNGSWLFTFRYDPSGGNITVEKGSICVNGVSLTCFDSGEGVFSVAIIPYTFEHTNFGRMKARDVVNLEFDIVGKYVQRLLTKA